MSRRGENIHKRKDGRWEGRYKKSTSPAEKSCYTSVYGKTYREVKEKLAEAIYSSSKNDLSQPSGVPFRDVLVRWLEDRQVSHKKATLAKYQDLIDIHIAPALGEYPVTQLTPTVINGFLTDKLDNGRTDGTGGLSPAYVRSMALIITSALHQASRENLCKPLQTPIPRPAIPRQELTILTRQQQTQLEEYLLRTHSLTAVGILISLYAGLRIGEVCALTWDDVDLADRVIHVRHTVARIKSGQIGEKSGTTLVIDTPKTSASQREIPISSLLQPVLEDVHEQISSGYVVSGSQTFLSPRTYTYRYHRLLKSAGIPPLNYHALRHTFATRCIEAGVDVKSLSEILGHSNVSVTLNTYVHSSMEMKRSQLEKLQSLAL